MPNPFAAYSVGIDGPAIGAQPVTPSDSADLPSTIRALTIGTAGGTLSYVSSIDGQIHTTGPLPLGTYALCAQRIRATGTSATGLTGWI